MPMLAIRPNCENCNKDLAPNVTNAMICSYECTYCYDCVHNVLKTVCPNCGGGFEKRHVRPIEMLEKHPAQTHRILKPVDMNAFAILRKRFKNSHPHER